MEATKALTTAEADKLEKFEAVIGKGMSSFLEVGNALAEIKQGKLYRSTYKTFENYCDKRWGFTRQRAHQLVYAADMAEELKAEVAKVKMSTQVDKTVPVANERQARELSRLPDNFRLDAWEKAVSRADGGAVSVAKVRAVVDETLAELMDDGEPNEPENEPVETESQLENEPEHEPNVMTDAVGNVITDPAITAVFGQVDTLKDLQRRIQSLRKDTAALADQPIGVHLRIQQIDMDLKSCWSAVKFAIPFALCPAGAGEKWEEIGWVTKDQYESWKKTQA